jgi:hypothetical protein
MEFGIGFWILFLVIFFGCGKMCGWGVRKYKHHQRELDAGSESERRLSELESRVRRLGDRDRAHDELVRPALHRPAEGGTPQPAKLKKRRSPLEELQQRFIDGRLTLAEYEEELDRLERLE